MFSARLSANAVQAMAGRLCCRRQSVTRAGGLLLPLARAYHRQGKIMNESITENINHLPVHAAVSARLDYRILRGP